MKTSRVEFSIVTGDTVTAEEIKAAIIKNQQGSTLDGFIEEETLLVAEVA
jgi:hypothetical protein